METLEEVLKHSCGSRIADISASNRMIHRRVFFCRAALAVTAGKETGLYPIRRQDPVCSQHSAEIDAVRGPQLLL